MDKTWCQFKKKNSQIWVYIDFRELTKVFLKDDFPFPYIEILIYTTTSCEASSFMDKYPWYNQIKMRLDDEEMTMFCSPKEVFCYRAMFSLKNAGPYTNKQWRSSSSKCFGGDTVDCYMDDLVVKSRQMMDHLRHLETVVGCLRQHYLKNNTQKCGFRVASQKF